MHWVWSYFFTVLNCYNSKAFTPGCVVELVKPFMRTCMYMYDSQNKIFLLCFCRWLSAMIGMIIVGACLTAVGIHLNQLTIHLIITSYLLLTYTSYLLPRLRFTFRCDLTRVLNLICIVLYCTYLLLTFYVPLANL